MNIYEDFLKRYYMEDILELGRNYPDRKTLTIDFLDVYKFNAEAAKRLLNQPDKEITALQEVLRNIDLPDSDTENLPDGVMPHADIAIRGLQNIDKFPIYRIGRDQTNKLVSIEGRITRIAPKFQRLTTGAFRCVRCSDLTFIPQPDEKYLEPFECSNDVCRRKGPFKLSPEDSIYEDQQKIGLQDLYESSKPGQPLRDIIVVLRRSELIRSIPGMGAQCTITGIVRLQQKKETNVYHTFFEALHIEPKKQEIDQSITESDKKEFREMALKDDIMEVLINSTAPDILGHGYIKAALLCANVSGGDNPKFRENMHLVLCGDPGTGKSALLKSIRAIVPRAQYSAGRGSSVAGLTVAVVKDELSGSGYTAQAGALVLADMGLMVLDEADKLEPDDFQALNTALEEGFIEIHKGGLNQRFDTRCSVIALCNPKNIRFEQYTPLPEQIGIPADTLSRFDLVFKILDIPNPNKDRAVAEHQSKQWAQYEKELLDIAPEEPEEGTISQEKLSKYLQFAKTFKPQSTQEAREAIIKYFLTLRKSDSSGTISTTARQNNGLYRLAKSIAKLRLSNVCDVSDANIAIKIYQASLEALRDPMTGKIDIDIISGYGKSQRQRVKAIRDIIMDLQTKKGNGSSAHFKDIISKGMELGIKEEHIEDDLRRLKHVGDIVESSNGCYRVVL